jgi:dTDP-4-amino-4,6-dideoxygalactose transaminase
MINLFHVCEHKIDTSIYNNLLHDNIVTVFEDSIKEFVGAKYAVTFNSATSAIFLSLLYKNIKLKVPSMIPPVVLNAIITSGNEYEFVDNIDWVGDSYTLHDFGDWKIVDSAQKLEKGQFIKECSDNDLMVFSFYPTKPIGTFDGGMIVSNDINKINHLKEMALNGMSYSVNNWERKIKFPGYKMYMNSFQADIALRNFKLYEDKLKKLKFVRDLYNKELGYNNTSNHLYRININDRDSFIDYMKNNDVSCGIHYESCHLNPVYRIDNTSYPLSEKESKTTVSIPFHEKLSKSDIIYIINKIKDYNGKENK